MATGETSQEQQQDTLPAYTADGESVQIRTAAEKKPNSAVTQPTHDPELPSSSNQTHAKFQEGT
jgi:hypothetical protein